MTFNRPSYLPSCAQADTYNQMSWPRNTLKSYAPQARGSYARGAGTASYAPRIPTLLRQAAVAAPQSIQPGQPVMGATLAVA